MPSSDIRRIDPNMSILDLVSVLPSHYQIVKQYVAMENLINTVTGVAEFRTLKEDKDQKKLL